MLSKRPHLGSEQLKYQYEVHVKTAGFLPHAHVSSATLSVLWTRGSKTAITRDFAIPKGERTAHVNQTLNLICTLFRDASGPISRAMGGRSSTGGASSAFAEKLCTFALIKHTKRGAQSVAKCKVDISKFADVPVDAPTSLTLQLSKGNDPIASLELSIASKWLKEMQVDSARGERGALGDSAMGSDGDSLSSYSSKSDRISALDDLMDEDMDEDSSSRGASSGDASFMHSGDPSFMHSDGRAADLSSVGPSALAQWAEGGATRSGSSFKSASAADQPPAAADESGPNGSRDVIDGRSRSMSHFGPFPGPHLDDSELHAKRQLHGLRLGRDASGLGVACGQAEAKLIQLQAQLSAAQTLQRKANARFEAERAGWEQEKDELRAEKQTSSAKMLQLEGALRQQTHEARTAGAALAEKNEEVQRLKAEKTSLQEQLKAQSPGMADYEDKIAWQQEQLDRSEQHVEEVARKLGKARKHQQSLLAQYEAEIEMLNHRLEQMEDEIGDEMQERLNMETSCAEAHRQLEEAQREVQELTERASRRTAIQPEGMQELQDQLEMAEEVRTTLIADIANLTEELVQVKLARAQEQEEREVLEQRLRRGTEKQRMLALRMTELEVKLADVTSGGAENDERIAEAFKEVMENQERQIRELKEQLAGMSPNRVQRKSFFS